MNDPIADNKEIKIISVTELNKLAKSLLENGIPKLWIEGEISNLARPASGHIYFSLKDETSQIRCAWFKQRQSINANDISNGTKMLALGKISLYQPRGEYQFIIEKMETAGEGDLKRKYEELKQKLFNEGLFDREKKLEIPKLPKKIGVITSPSGAAIRDVLSILKRRFPLLPIVIFPITVQGDNAAPDIENALKNANLRADCDVLILTRGGGSLEDLWAFNEEIVARAIHASKIPIISAIGHETDTTIADFVSDIRAPTPSGAAEIVTPDQNELLKLLKTLFGRIEHETNQYINSKSQSMDWLSKRLSQSNPIMTVRKQIEISGNLRKLLFSSIGRNLSLNSKAVDSLKFRLNSSSPKLEIQKAISHLSEMQLKITTSTKNSVTKLNSQLTALGKTLDSLSPLKTLDRGYAVARDSKTKKIISNSEKVSINSQIDIKLAKGEIAAKVIKRKG
jgi:exodeoxyribonuclease VII large subunit